MSVAVRSSLALLTLAGLASPLLAEETRIPIVAAPELPALGSAPDATLSADAIAEGRYRSGDTAALLRNLPGVAVSGGSGLAGLPVVRGLGDDRLRIKVDGMDLVSACPNHMNSPLSYLDPTAVAKADVYAGIAPVSLGGDSIGGTIVVESAPSLFAEPGQTLLTGSAGAFYRSNGDGRGVNLTSTLAGANVSLNYTGSGTRANNYDAGGSFKPGAPVAGGGWVDGDEVGSTAYRSVNHAVKLGLRGTDQQADISYRYQHVPFEGFPNQRMDLTDNETDQVNAGYRAQFGWGDLTARAYHEATDHRMNFGDDRQFWYMDAPGMPMQTRGRNTGATLAAALPLTDIDTLRLGAEYQRYRLEDSWPPSGSGMMMAPGTFQNINDGQRDRHAAYGEWERRWDDAWQTLLGARYERVRMDAADVHGYSMMYAGDAAAFNARDHGRSDDNWDVTTLLRYTPGSTATYSAGLAQKTRSPNLYERYTWSGNAMAAIMNNLVGDGNGYVGNLDLDPEIARTLSLAADWHDAAQTRWSVRLSPYYTRVEDYIDARCAPGKTCLPNRFNVLQYDNVSARLYGVDLSGHIKLARGTAAGDFTLDGVFGYVNGENRDTGDGLYNVHPLHGTLSLGQTLGGWRSALEAEWWGRKDDVSDVRNEIETASYALLHLRTSYTWRQVRVDAGVENLFDRRFALPLGGAYVGQGSTMGINSVPWGIAVAGPGRSLYAGVSYSF
ncbi:MAG: TonB-dependent receptor plug domain-containing protein [Immundisolibacter sp.]|uniref:TonB-dependent receptor plug domain-containing protein n=1 Tax=Immundisolibacter sp. TaxID=1934948 RepID=UPI003D1284F3